MRLDPTNPMGKVMLSILAFEAVIFALVIAGLIQVEGWLLPAAFGLGLGGAALALLALALLRRPPGYPLGWLVQVVAVGMGFATAMMFALGGAFALLWVTCFILGRRIEAPYRSGESR